MITPYKDKEYILIQPSEIPDIPKPEFGTRGRRTEAEYRQLIKDSQEYFQQYIENPNNRTYWLIRDVMWLVSDVIQGIFEYI